MRTLAEAQSQFAYHPATEDTAPRHALVRDLFRDTLDQLWKAVPDGPEKTLAIRKLQEAQMYANLAIALTAPADTSDTRSVARTLPKCQCAEPGAPCPRPVAFDTVPLCKECYERGCPTRGVARTLPQ